MNREKLIHLITNYEEYPPLVLFALGILGISISYLTLPEGNWQERLLTFIARGANSYVIMQTTCHIRNK